MSFDFTPGDGTPMELEIDKFDRQDSAHNETQKAIIKIDYDLCEDTGVCAQVCPEQVIEFKNGHSHVVKPESCTECWICVENCATGAVEIG